MGAVLSIGIGEGPAEMHQALDLCREFNGAARNLPRLYASAGIYPHNTPEADDAALAKLDALLAEPEVIACGEIGLDYYHEGAPRDVQRQGLIRQLEIAAARKRPILIHCRGTNESTDAWDDLFLVLDEHWRTTGLGGIMHCFGAGWEQARRSLDMGFLVSFAGNLTYPKAQPLRDVAARMPLDGVLVETDAPWLAPAPASRPAQRAGFRGPDGPGSGRAARRFRGRNRRGHHEKLLPAVSPSPRRGKLIEAACGTGALAEFEERKAMAQENSFDIVSKVDIQEVRNAIDQAIKEIRQRFDLKDSHSESTSKATTPFSSPRPTNTSWKR